MRERMIFDEIRYIHSIFLDTLLRTVIMGDGYLTRLIADYLRIFSNGDSMWTYAENKSINCLKVECIRYTIIKIYFSKSEFFQKLFQRYKTDDIEFLEKFVNFRYQEQSYRFL